MRKFLLLFLFVVLAVVLVNIPVFIEKSDTFIPVEVRNRQIDDKNVVGEPITAAEINSFLKIWPDYIRSFVSKVGVWQLSFTTSANPEKRVSLVTKAWINRKGWDVNRFFYVEERLKAIVSTLKAEDRAAKTTKILQRKLEMEKNQKIKENIRKEIAYQKDLVNIEKVTRAERDLVRPYLSELAKMLQEVEGN